MAPISAKKGLTSQFLHRTVSTTVAHFVKASCSPDPKKARVVRPEHDERTGRIKLRYHYKVQQSEFSVTTGGPCYRLEHWPESRFWFAGRRHQPRRAPGATTAGRQPSRRVSSGGRGPVHPSRCPIPHHSVDDRLTRERCLRAAHTPQAPEPKYPDQQPCSGTRT